MEMRYYERRVPTHSCSSRRAKIGQKRTFTARENNSKSPRHSDEDFVRSVQAFFLAVAWF